VHDVTQRRHSVHLVSSAIGGTTAVEGAIDGGKRDNVDQWHRHKARMKRLKGGCGIDSAA